MQSFFTFAIEFVFVSSVVFFTTAFVMGFIHRDRSRRTVVNDAVIPFSRPYRQPEAAEMVERIGLTESITASHVQHSPACR